MSKGKEIPPYPIQHQANHERSKQLYPNGFGSSGMAAIGNAVQFPSSKGQRWELERPKKGKE